MRVFVGVCTSVLKRYLNKTTWSYTIVLNVQTDWLTNKSLESAISLQQNTSRLTRNIERYLALTDLPAYTNYSSNHCIWSARRRGLTTIDPWSKCHLGSFVHSATKCLGSHQPVSRTEQRTCQNIAGRVVFTQAIRTFRSVFANLIFTRIFLDPPHPHAGFLWISLGLTRQQGTLTHPICNHL